MTQVLLTILIIINILMLVGSVVLVYFLYKKIIKPMGVSKQSLKSSMTQMKQAMDMLNDFKIPNQWNK